MDRALVRRWAAGHAAAAKRSLEVMHDEGPASPEVAFDEAMDLVDLVSDMDDPFREQQVARARAAWAKLRAWAASRERR